MIGLILVAALSGSPPTVEPMPNLFRPPSRCGPLHDEVARRIRTSTAGRSAILQYAVLRTVDGCGVPAPVGYHPDYLAPGAADPQSGPRPEDGPGNRR
jgi:hypothetical protein